MDRQYLLQLLGRYKEKWEAEKETVDQFIGFVKQYPDCFKRSLSIGHVTGSAWVVNKAGSHVLLTHHKKLGCWLQLGGHADGDPNIPGVALREAVEESGLDNLVPIDQEIFDLDIHRIPANRAEAEHYHYDVRFAFRAQGDTAYTVSDESHDLRWVPLDALSKYSTEITMHRMASKWQAKNGQRHDQFMHSGQSE